MKMLTNMKKFKIGKMSLIILRFIMVRNSKNRMKMVNRMMDSKNIMTMIMSLMLTIKKSHSKKTMKIRMIKKRKKKSKK